MKGGAIAVETMVVVILLVVVEIEFVVMWYFINAENYVELL